MVGRDIFSLKVWQRYFLPEAEGKPIPDLWIRATEPSSSQ